MLAKVERVERRTQTTKAERAARRIERKWKKFELEPAEYDCWLKRNRVPHDWKTQLVAHARHRGRRKGLASDLRVEDIHWPTHCPVLKIKLNYPEVIQWNGRGKGMGKIRPDTPTLDRFDNSKGYIPGNVIVISWRANKLKGDATAEEMRNILAYLEDYDLL